MLLYRIDLTSRFKIFFSIASDRSHHGTLNGICFVKFRMLLSSSYPQAQNNVVPAADTGWGL